MPQLALFLLLFLPFVSVQADAPRTFREAKKIAWTIYAERPVDFYCGCACEGNRSDPAGGGSPPREQPNPAAHVAWDHVVPPCLFGHPRQCWQQGGRKPCPSKDPVFSKAEADLHNLVALVGEVNGDR